LFPVFAGPITPNLQNRLQSYCFFLIYAREKQKIVAKKVVFLSQARTEPVLSPSHGRGEKIVAKKAEFSLLHIELFDDKNHAKAKKTTKKSEMRHFFQEKFAYVKKKYYLCARKDCERDRKRFWHRICKVKVELTKKLTRI